LIFTYRRIQIVGIADHLAVLRVADEDEVIPLSERVVRLVMHIVDELACGVEDLQASRSGSLVK
jgi:hypothetical protein